MPPPLSGEARVTVPSLLVFYTFFATLIYNKLIVSEEVGLPPLKGEVAKIDNFNCQFLTEGSGQPINLILRFYRHNEFKLKYLILVIAMSYNEILQELRKDKGLSQTQLAEIFLTTQRTISNWESGRNEPPYDMLIKYAKYFNVSTDYILGLTRNEK